MLTTKQFTILLLTAIFSAAFTAFLVIGIYSRDFTFSIISLVLLILVFVIGVMTTAAPKNRVGDVHIGGKLNPEFEDSEK